MAPGLNQLARSHGRLLRDMLAETDGVYAPGLRLHPPRIRQLLEVSKGRLVRHVVLAMLHDANAKRRPFIRHGSADDQVNSLIFQDLLDSLGLFALWKCRLEAGDPLGIDIMEANQLRAGIQHHLNLPVDMPVLKANGGESYRHVVFCSDLCLLAV